MIGLLVIGLGLLAFWLYVKRIVRTATASFQERMAPYQKDYTRAKQSDHRARVFDGEFEEVSTQKVKS